MPWVRLDEGFARHPKVAAAGPLGLAMQVAGLCYCNQYLTDGFVPRHVVPSLLNLEGIAMNMWHNETIGGGDDATWELVVATLTETGLWRQVEGGYEIHDYLTYQPSKADVVAERKQKSEAGRLGGIKSAKTRTAKTSRNEAPAQAPAQAKSQHPPKQNASKTQAEAQAESKPGSVPVSKTPKAVTSTYTPAREDHEPNGPGSEEEETIDYDQLERLHQKLAHATDAITSPFVGHPRERSPQ